MGHEHDDDYKSLLGDFSPCQISLLDTERGGDLGEFFSGHGFYSEKTVENDLNSLLMFENPEFLPPQEENFNISLLSGIPNDHGLSCKQSNRIQSKEFNEGEQRTLLSTEEVMRVASAFFIQTSSLKSGDHTKLGLPFGLSTSTLFGKDHKNVELATLLLAAAEKVSNEQYSRAKSLLRQCDMSASKFGNPIQGVVYYFSDALQNRIDQKTQDPPSKRAKETGSMTRFDITKALRTSHPVQLVGHNSLPFMQVLQFTAIQVLLDNLSSAKRIHVIDFSIKYSQQWALFLQAVSTRYSCPVESVTISGVGEERSGGLPRLEKGFAQSLNMPFRFRAVIVADVKELRETMFQVEERETVIVYTSLDMNSLIVKPQSLDNLMKVMKKVKPSIVTVMDIQANLNSPHFIRRFTEALFFYSAYFDCFDCLMRGDENRLIIERVFMAQGIKSMLANEWSERVFRYVGLNVWRVYFRRFGLKE